MLLRKLSGCWPRTRNENGTRWNRERCLRCLAIHLAAYEIVYSGAAGKNDAGSQYRTRLNEDSLVHAAVAPDERFIFDDYRQGAGRFQHAADLSRGGKMHAFPDLSART